MWRIKSPETQKKCLIVKHCDDQSCEQQKLFTFQAVASKVWGMAGIINRFGTITFTSLLILKMEKSGCFPIKPDTIPQHPCSAKPRLYQSVDTVVWCLQAPGNLFFFNFTLHFVHRLTRSETSWRTGWIQNILDHRFRLDHRSSSASVVLLIYPLLWWTVASENHWFPSLPTHSGHVHTDTGAFGNWDFPFSFKK